MKQKPRAMRARVEPHRLLTRTTWLVLSLFLLPLAAQTPVPPTEREALARELKAEIDEALIDAMRRLRRDLHRLVDERLADRDWPPRGALASPGIPPVARTPSPAPVDGLDHLAALEARVRTLRRNLGPDHPEVRGLEREAAEIRNGLGMGPKTARDPGLTLDGESGGPWRVTAVVPGGIAARAGIRRGDYLLGYAPAAATPRGKPSPITTPQELVQRWRAAKAGRPLRLSLMRAGEGHPAVTRHVVGLRPSRDAARRGDDAVPDTRRMVDEMMKRAIEKVVPRGGGFLEVPARPRDAAPPKESPPRDRRER